MQRNGKRVKALLITVHYGDPQTTLELLRSLSRMERLSECHVLLVDNEAAASSRTAFFEAITLLPNSEFYQAAENHGYFGAARFAFDRYLSEGHDLPDWVIVCNHDVLIEDEDFFSKLFAHEPARVGILAPGITIPWQGIEQNPFMRQRPGWLRWNSLRLIYSNYSTAAIWDWLSRKKGTLKSLFGFRALNRSSNGSVRQEQIYAAHGAFFIFSRKYFEAGGYLDGNLFLYGEEISVAEICRSLGLPVVYEPSLRVLHNEHQSTGKRISRFSYECQKNALEYVTSRYLSGARRTIESAN